MNCDTVGVVYLLTCGCGIYYVGKTKCNFWRRIKDHVSDIRCGILNSLVARHFTTQHLYKVDSLEFQEQSCKVTCRVWPGVTANGSKLFFLKKCKLAWKFNFLFKCHLLQYIVYPYMWDTSRVGLTLLLPLTYSVVCLVIRCQP